MSYCSHGIDKGNNGAAEDGIGNRKASRSSVVQAENRWKRLGQAEVSVLRRRF